MAPTIDVAFRIEEAERYIRLIDEANDPLKWRILRDDALARSDLPLALALIHPHVWEERVRKTQLQGQREFRGPKMYRPSFCDAQTYWGVRCEIDTTVEGAAADHAWPYGLGGPTVAGNIVYLCRLHNLMKSVDVHLYPWEDWPVWLEDYMNRLERYMP